MLINGNRITELYDIIIKQIQNNESERGAYIWGAGLKADGIFDLQIVGPI